MRTSTPVVDLGCHSHPNHQGAGQDSVAALIARFNPRALYGFDPHPDLVEGKTLVGRCTVTLTRAAAWFHDGTVAYDPRPGTPLAAAVGDGPMTVRCFDLARWLAGRRVIVKMDVEGAEYPLLEHVCAQGRDLNIELLLVEWHAPPAGPDDWQARQEDLLRALSCPVEDWDTVRA